MGENDGAGLPMDPITAMAEGAANMHELYLSFQRAGFADSQALYLVGQVLRGTISSGPSSD